MSNTGSSGVGLISIKRVTVSLIQPSLLIHKRTVFVPASGQLIRYGPGSLPVTEPPSQSQTNVPPVIRTPVKVAVAESLVQIAKSGSSIKSAVDFSLTNTT